MRWLLLTLCSGFVSALICSNTTYAEYYFQWCLTDSECQDNLHLFDDDLWSFTETLNNELIIPMHLNSTSLCDAVVEPFWQALLRTVNLCYPNHYRDSAGVCTLQPGRLEDPAVDFRNGLSGVSSPFMLAALIAVVLWFGVKSLRAWHTVEAHFNAQDQQPITTSEDYNAAIAPKMEFRFG